MLRWAVLALTAVLAAGCSGKAFEAEILGEGPQPTEARQAPPAETAPAAASAQAAAAVPPAAVPPAPVSSAPAPVPMLTYQVGSFSHEENSLSLKEMFLARGYAARMEPAMIKGRTYYRVFADMPGPEGRAVETLASLGVNGPRLISVGRAPAPPPAAPPAPQATPAPTAAQTTPPPPPARPAAAQTPPPPPARSAAAQTPPPARPAAVSPTAPAGSRPSFCRVDASRITAEGTSRGNASDPLMGRKEAIQNAKRNLLICIDAYKTRGRAGKKTYRVEAYLPEGVVSVGTPVFRSDGTVAASASIAVKDVDSISITRYE